MISRGSKRDLSWDKIFLPYFLIQARDSLYTELQKPRVFSFLGFIIITQKTVPGKRSLHTFVALDMLPKKKVVTKITIKIANFH